MKRKLLSILIFAITAFFCVMPFCSAEDNSSDGLKPRVRQEKVSEDKVKDGEKTEKNNVLSKFLVSMLWVAGSCFAIFLILLAYKRLTETSIGQTKNTDVSKNLNSPETVDDAVKFFIEKF